MPDTAPQHWHSLSGPSNWYRLWYPPEWTASQHDTMVTLAPADGSALLSVHAACSREAEHRPLSEVVPVEAFFPEARETRPVAVSEQERESIGFEGRTRLEESPRWWTRPLSKPDDYPWRIWAVREGPVIVVASMLHSQERDRELESLAGMIVRALAISQHPADLPEVFAQRVAELARTKFPLLECELGEEFQLQLGQSSMNLYNFYRSYVQSPEKFEQIVLPALTTIVQIQGWGEEQSTPPLEEVRDRIMPMLYPESTWRENFPNFIGRPWVGGLMILYVVDESHAYWYIRDDLLTAWNATLDELHEIAVSNLDAYFERKPMELAVAGGDDHPVMLMPTHPDSYNAVRLLSESFRARAREVVGGTFAVGVPNRDFFIIAGLGSKEMLAQIRHKVRGDNAEMDHPLSGDLLLVSPDGVSELPADES